MYLAKSGSVKPKNTIIFYRPTKQKQKKFKQSHKKTRKSKVNKLQPIQSTILEAVKINKTIQENYKELVNKTTSKVNKITSKVNKTKSKVNKTKSIKVK